MPENNMYRQKKLSCAYYAIKEFKGSGAVEHKSSRLTTRSALFVWLISHQPAVLFSQNKPATSNQPAVLFSQNKPAPAISHQPNEQAGS
jgi:hypothetical protein